MEPPPTFFLLAAPSQPEMARARGSGGALKHGLESRAQADLGLCWQAGARLHTQGLVSGAGAPQTSRWRLHPLILSHLPLGPGQLEDLLPHREQPLALVLEADSCGLHGPDTQLPLAPPVQELDRECGG